ncbi:MAG: MATE family efflux transporter, partial [Oliverpabstia sp.]
MASKVKNMTSGSPGKLIMAFAMPLMLGNIFQQLYTMVDTMVVGQIVGVEALAALGAADWLVWLVLGLASGMTQGFSILVS